MYETVKYLVKYRTTKILNISQIYIINVNISELLVIRGKNYLNKITVNSCQVT